MELKTAIGLIEKGVDKAIDHQRWADLGAGKGLFTRALGSILRSGIIYAVDKDAAALRGIHAGVGNVAIKKSAHDFIAKELIDTGITEASLNGILLANALHFAANKRALLHRLKKYLMPSGKLIIVEYDIDKANPWIPYPISFSDLASQVTDYGFRAVTKIASASSVYHDAGIYCAVLH